MGIEPKYERLSRNQIRRKAFDMDSELFERWGVDMALIHNRLKLIDEDAREKADSMVSSIALKAYICILGNPDTFGALREVKDLVCKIQERIEKKEDRINDMSNYLVKCFLSEIYEPEEAEQIFKSLKAS